MAHLNSDFADSAFAPVHELAAPVLDEPEEEEVRGGKYDLDYDDYEFGDWRDQPDA